MKIVIFFCLICISFSACKKTSSNPVANIPFDISINLNLPSYSALQGIGGYCYVEGGVQGIVVYRKSNDEFVAFDRQSPASQTKCITPLIINKDNFLQLDDSCTQAKFSLFDGSAISGSEVGLRAYQTYWNKGNLLRIYN